MRKNFLYGFCFCLLLLAGCVNKDVADVDKIKVEIEKKRFEEDFFEIDTSQLETSLWSAAKKISVILYRFQRQDSRTYRNGQRAEKFGNQTFFQ